MPVLNRSGSELEAASARGSTLRGMAPTSLVNRPLYGMAEVDALIGLTSGTARRWIDGYSRDDRQYPPLIRPETTHDQIATWGEFVETRLISEYRDGGVAVSRLRDVIDELRNIFDTQHPLAHAHPFLENEGREVVLRVQEQVDLADELRLVVRSGQTILPAPEVTRFQDVATFSATTHEATRIRLHNTIVLDPDFASGSPVVAGRPLRAETLVEAHRTGLTPVDIGDMWAVDVASVRDAIDWASLQALEVA